MTMRARTGAMMVALALSMGVPAIITPPTAQAQELTEAMRVRIARRLARSTVYVIAGPATGSGFVVSDERWIITNNHVVEGVPPGAEIHVRFGSGTTLSAHVLETDRSHDLALIEVTGRVPCPPLEMGDSDDVETGQQVLAYGSPFGFEGTLTEGIVSARRDVPGVGGVARRLIQTDASINPGNSGGPLVDRQGHVIGVNTAIYSQGQGIGFAVPSNYVREFVDSVRERHGHPADVAHDASGTSPQVATTPTPQPALPPARRLLGVTVEDYTHGSIVGVRVTSVAPGSGAQHAGIVGADQPPPALVARLHVPWTGHVITAVDGHMIRSVSDLDTYLASRNPGDTVRLSVRLGSGSGALSGETNVVLDR